MKEVPNRVLLSSYHLIKKGVRLPHFFCYGTNLILLHLINVWDYYRKMINWKCWFGKLSMKV